MNYSIFSLILSLLGAVSVAILFNFILLRVGGVGQDIPNERSSHRVPTPRGGGVAFCAVFFVMLAVFFIWKREYFSAGSGVLSLTWLVIASLGFYEDRFGVPARIRLLMQFLAAIVLAGSGFFWTDFGVFGFSFSPPPFLCVPVSVLFIVWVTNLYNFMDGINGIAAVQGLVTSALFCAVALLSENVVLATISGMLFVSILGFLPFNFPKARIFMGDSGSLFLGFVFATLPFMSNGVSRFSMEFVAISIGPFLADALITLMIRIWRHENLAQAHRSHFYQKFQILTGSHTIATLTYGGFGILFAFVGFLRLYGSGSNYSFALAGSLLILGSFFLWVHRAFELRGGSKL